MTKENNNFLKIMFGVLTFLSVIILINVMSADDSHNAVAKIITSGIGEMDVEPDQSTITLLVRTNGVDAKDSSNMNSEISNAVIKKMNSIVGEKNVETSYYNVYENNVWDYNTKKYIANGFIASHTIKVTSNNISNTGLIIDEALLSGATGIQGVSFGLSEKKEDEVLSESLNLAVLDAKNKANAIAKSGGVKLGKVIEISETKNYYSPLRKSDLSNVEMYDSDTVPTVISPETLTITSSVDVQYSIS